MITRMRHWMSLLESFALPTHLRDQAVTNLAELVSNSNSGTGYIAFDMGCRDDPYGETDEECWEREFPRWCEQVIEAAFSKITARFQNGKLPIWRVITAPPDWQPQEDDYPGIYWSYEPDAAQAHWGDYNGNHVEWMLSAQANFDQIDWPVTLAQNAMPDFEEEKEIRLAVDVIPFTYVRKL